jgi:exopolysaccharide production protein ExoQ
MPFLAAAVLLIVIAFTVPFSEAWKRSTLEDFVNPDRMVASSREGTLTRQLALGSLGLFGATAFAWPGRRQIHLESLLGVLCLSYLAWCAATLLWTDDLGTSLRRLAAMACEIMAGLAIAKHASARQLVWIVFWCTLSWLGLGIAAEFSQGTFRPWHADYRFSGIFHPNEMGVACALLAASALYLCAGRHSLRRVLLPIAALGGVLLLLTGSRTALAALVLAMVVLWFVTARRSGKLLYASVITVAGSMIILALSVGMLTFSTKSVALGRDDHDVSSFTGRIPLWRELVQVYAHDRPLLGHGFGAFWTAKRITDVSESQGWAVPNAHSSYIDLVLGVGFIGAVLYLSAMFLAIAVALRKEIHLPKAGFGFIAILIIYGLVDGVLESTVDATWFASVFEFTGVCCLLFEKSRDPSKFVSAPLRVPRIPAALSVRRRDYSQEGG